MTGTSTSCCGVPSAADGAKAATTSAPGEAVNAASKVPRPGAPSEAVTVCCDSTLPSRTSWTTSVASKTLAVPET